MKRLLPLFLLIICLTFIVAPALVAQNDIYSRGVAGSPIKGNWSHASTWYDSIPPSPGDNVYISSGDSVTFDVSISLNNLTIGDDGGGVGALSYSSSIGVKDTVFGSVQIYPGCTFRNISSSLSSNPVLDTLFVYGDFINQGSDLAFRAGTSPLVGVTYLIFKGSTNSTFQSTGAYSSSTIPINRINGVTIDKTGTANVILASDLFLDSGSSSYPTSQPYLDLKHGLIVTNQYSVVSRSTAANSPNAIIEHASDSSYILGSFGRGMSSGSAGTREFPLGDIHGYHPIRVRNASPGGATGHNLRVRLLFGNANPSSSTPTGGIDKVSTVRYYKLTYDQSPADAGTSASMSFDRFLPSYQVDDGVVEGNSDLRAAYTTDSLINWKGLAQVAYQDTTVFADSARFWQSDSLPSGSLVTLTTFTNGGKSAYVALARATGTTENTLIYSPADVKTGKGLPAAFSLSQNYPNPFNPSTTIEYSLPKASHVVLGIYNILGQSVATLVDADMNAGTYTMNYNASGLSSGVYYYRLATQSSVFTKKMLIAK